MTDYEISVIIPTFNLADSIEKTFNSVKSQTIGFDKLEVIFVDDVSSDNTFDILKGYEEKYSNIKALTTGTNSGYAGKPRNIGIANATADYILFLDGDDELLIDSCQYLLNKAKSTDSDITIGGQINVFKNGVLQHNPPLFAGMQQEITNTIDANLLSMRPAITAKLFKRDLIRNIRFKEDIPGQDLVFFLEAGIKSKKVTTLNNFYVYYRNLNDNSVTFTLNDRYFHGLIKAYTCVCDLFEKNNISFKIQEVVLHNHLSFFTSQTLKASQFNNLEHIFTTDLFRELSEKEVIKRNENFTRYFEEMKRGNYKNRYLDLVFDSLDIKSDNISLRYLKDEIKNIKLAQNKVINENEYLKKSNSNLYEKGTELLERYEKLNDENSNLKNEIKELKNKNNELEGELDEIKSTKLWKLKSKF